MNRARHILRRTAGAVLFVLLCVLALALLEGFASLWLVLQTARHYVRPLAERSHTRYDPEIGWLNRPNVRLRDFYGPGRTLTTNARGFRGAREVGDRAAARTRIICSGDSFTLGMGVGNDATWCHLLEVLDPGCETVNMGQGGYGIDQAWLWYRRDARTIAHQIHVFAFIPEDFQRMLSREFFTYGKPVLRLEGNELKVDNVPVPRRRYVPWLTENQDVVRELRSVRVLAALFARLERPVARATGAEPPPPSALPLALAVFDDLARLNRERGSLLVLVLLPMRDHYEADPADGLRAFLARELNRRGIAYIDLIPEIRRVPAGRVDRLFLPDVEGPVPGIDGHYSEEGNLLIATALDARLRAIAGHQVALD